MRQQTGTAWHRAAAQGISGAGGSLPHLDAIQQSFGSHDVSQVQAHTDGAAAAGSAAMGAEAFATGDHVAFGGTPSLHTAAHEAAHVVQQRAGVQLRGGVGESGDVYERQADEVADRVVAGRPAHDLLPPPSQSSSHAVQRRPRLTGADWRNALIEGTNRIQDVVRAAQKAKHGRIELDLLIEPDFVGVHRHAESGTAPSEKEDPDGFAIAQAADQALSIFTDEAPPSRKIVTVVLERTTHGWDRSSFVTTGETKGLDEADQQFTSGAAWSIGNYLQLAHDAGQGEVKLQVAMSEDGVKIVSWQATGTAKKANKKPSTEKAEKSFENLASLMQGRLLIYELTDKLGNDGWEQTGFQLLGEVKAMPAPTAGGGDGEYMDEGEMAIEDVNASRRLVLTTAAKLIAEQDPTRLDNLIFSVGPFAAVGVLKLGKLAKLGRLGKLSKLFGRPARRILGETKFRGLIQNRPLRESTDSEVTHAFSNTSFTLSNHANMRLRDVRTEAIGVNTLNDVAAVLNDGVIQATKHADDADEVIEIVGRNMNAIVNVETNLIISFSFVPR